MPLNDDVDPATFAGLLERLAEKIDALAAAVGSTRPAAPRLAFRIEELAEALGVGKRTIQREVSAGRFPPASRRLGKVPIWAAETITGWLAREGRP